MAADDTEKLLMRSKKIYDGAIPSGNSVAVFNLLRFGHLTGNSQYLTQAEQIIRSLSAEVSKYPAGHSRLMAALEFSCKLPTTSADQMLKNIRQNFCLKSFTVR